MTVETPAILAEGLVKRFGTVLALDGVDLVVPQGTVLGLLGPNGAGKTTAVRILTTILQPDAGSARVLGFDVCRQPGEIRTRIGLAGQYAAVDENLTGRENLIMVGRLTHQPRAGIVDGLEERGYVVRQPHPTDRRVKVVAITALGEKAKTTAIARMHEPPAAMLDALTQNEQRTLRDLLRKIRDSSNSRQ